MKKIISLFLAAALLSCFLISCSGGLVKMEYNDEGALEAANGTLYKYAPVGYEPTNQGEEYGLINSTLSEKLYRIGELDPEKWLTTEYTGATTTVYYSADISLPTLTEMEPTLCYICEQGDNTYSLYTVGDSKNGKVDEERAVIKKLMEMLSDSSVESSLWPRSDSAETYDLKMYSEDWPAIYYNLVYVREGESNYLYDRVNKRCIDVGTILEGYFEKAE